MLVLLWLVVVVLFVLAVAGVVWATAVSVRKVRQLTRETEGLLYDYDVAVGSRLARRP